MPILQSIQQAEEKAQSLRNNANLQVQDLIKEKKVAAELKIAELNAQTLDEIKNSEAKTIKQLQALDQSLDVKKQEVKTDLTSKAMRKMDQAVTLMMKKVGNV